MIVSKLILSVASATAVRKSERKGKKCTFESKNNESLLNSKETILANLQEMKCAFCRKKVGSAQGESDQHG